MERFNVWKILVPIAVVLCVGCASKIEGTGSNQSGAGTGTGGTQTDSAGTGSNESGAGTGTGGSTK